MKKPNSSHQLFTFRFSLLTALALFVFHFSLLTVAQQPNLDSLWSIWEDETQSDSIRLQAMQKFAWKGYLFSQPDSAFYFAQMQYNLAEKSGLKRHMAQALNTQGISFAIRSDYPKALVHFRRSLKINEEIGNKNGMAGDLTNIGSIYMERGNYAEALAQFQRGLKLREEVGDQAGISRSLGSIANIYVYQGDYPNALNYNQRSLDIMEEMGDKRGIATGLNNIGTIYKDQGNYSKALAQFQRSSKISEEIGNKNGIARSLNSIGNVYTLQGDKSKALDHYQRSFKISEEMGDKNGIATSLVNIGRIYQDHLDHQKAIDQCRSGLLAAQEIQAISLQRDACRCLYDAYKATGNGNKALNYHEQMLVLDDSLNAEETAKLLQQMEFAKTMLADSLKQEEEKLKVEMAHQQEVAKKEKTRNWAFAGGGLLLLLAIGLYSRVRYVRKAKARVEKEKDRSENLLLNILPAEIAEELKEKGEAKARDFEMVSILFTDFKGFTQASEKLSAADLVAEINTCFKAFDGIVDKYNIEKIKTIGDAYMCAGGLPVPDENATKNTVLAGLEMQAFMKTRKAERDAAGLPAFEMRVGIHTGPVVAGIVGVKKFAYDIWGDTVNTASRMESSGEVGQVNISEATYEQVKGNSEFGFTSRGKVEAKGKGQMEMLFVSIKK